MAKPRKTNENEKEQMLETPAGTAVATEAPIRQDWPEATETRELNISLTEPQMIEQGRTLVDYLRESESLAQAKKASADNFKARIEAVEKKIEDVSIIVKSGKDRREVVCRWVFQANGLDAEGEPIYHSELKTLMRMDTMEVVETKPITFEDRQVNLPLDLEDSLEVNMRALTDAGFSLMETPDDSAAETPFILVDPDGDETPIEADSMAEAAVQARALLPAAS